MRYTSQRQVRAAFWHDLPGNDARMKPRKYYGKSQNELPTDIRCAFVDYVDHLARDGAITENLAQRVTL
jgi:hypothetical protein